MKRTTSNIIDELKDDDTVKRKKPNRQFQIHLYINHGLPGEYKERKLATETESSSMGITEQSVA